MEGKGGMGEKIGENIEDKVIEKVEDKKEEGEEKEHDHRTDQEKRNMEEGGFMNEEGEHGGGMD